MILRVPLVFAMYINALLMMNGLLPAPQEPTQLLQKGAKMNNPRFALPFGLTDKDLPNVEIMYAFNSAKTGAGKQELTLRGSGKVTLLLTRTMGGKPVVLEGHVDPKIVACLLDFMAGQEFLKFEDTYPAHDASANRVLQLVLPNQTKTVMLEGPGFTAFEMVAGATKFAAALALPEALNHRFFPNL
jgi:hypothetical protein